MSDPKIEIAKFKSAEQQAEGWIERHPRLTLIGGGCLTVTIVWLAIKAFA